MQLNFPTMNFFFKCGPSPYIESVTFDEEGKINDGAIEVSTCRNVSWFHCFTDLQIPPDLIILRSSLKVWGTIEPWNIPAEQSRTSYAPSSIDTFFPSSFGVIHISGFWD